MLAERVGLLRTSLCSALRACLRQFRLAPGQSVDPLRGFELCRIKLPAPICTLPASECWRRGWDYSAHPCAPPFGPAFGSSDWLPANRSTHFVGSNCAELSHRRPSVLCWPLYVGGEGGIRTHEGLAPLPVFKTGAFNRSATSPCMRNRYRVLSFGLSLPSLNSYAFRPTIPGGRSPGPSCARPLSGSPALPPLRVCVIATGCCRSGCPCPH